MFDFRAVWTMMSHVSSGNGQCNIVPSISIYGDMVRIQDVEACRRHPRKSWCGILRRRAEVNKTASVHVVEGSPSTSIFHKLFAMPGVWFADQGKQAQHSQQANVRREV